MVQCHMLTVRLIIYYLAQLSNTQCCEQICVSCIGESNIWCVLSVNLTGSHNFAKFQIDNMSRY